MPVPVRPRFRVLKEESFYFPPFVSVCVVQGRQLRCVMLADYEYLQASLHTIVRKPLLRSPLLVDTRKRCAH